MKAASCAFAVLLFAPVLGYADPLSQRGLEEGTRSGPELSDAMIDEKRGALERVLSRRNVETARQTNEAVALEAKLKTERLDFEKKQIADRKSFLESLKKETDPKKRASLYGKFDSQQKNDRRRFFNGQMDQRDELTAQFRKATMIDHDTVAASAPPAAASKPAAKPAAAKPAAAKPAAKK